jgi:hypothetical protein
MPFWIWKHIHIHKVHVYEMHAREMHAHEVHAYEVHAHKIDARKVHAHEIHAHEVHASEMIVSGLHRHRRYRWFLPTRVWPERVGPLPTSAGETTGSRTEHNHPQSNGLSIEESPQQHRSPPTSSRLWRTTTVIVSRTS